MADKNPRKAATARPATKQQEHLEELMRAVNSVATAKGWNSHAASKDEQNYRFATVNVDRYYPGDARTVSATIDITLDEKIRISPNKTSFYGHGLVDLVEAIWAEIYRLPWVQRPKKPETPQHPSHLDQMICILRRFHSMARQLRHRHDNRPAFVITDEYDVQDLLHAILRGLYEDVRAEEYTPSYAGGSSRVDFLLKKERCVIEAKIASERLKDKLIGDQLILDIKKYQAHPDCRTLVCFVYDPGGHVRNPAGLEADLSGKHNELQVSVVIVSP